MSPLLRFSSANLLIAAAVLGSSAAASAFFPREGTGSHEGVRVSADPTIRVQPTKVRAGKLVSVYGYARGCPVGDDELTLISRAFSARQEFAGEPAIYADVRNEEGFFRKATRIPTKKRPGKYTITGRCGGGNIGVRATLRVLRP